MKTLITFLMLLGAAHSGLAANVATVKRGSEFPSTNAIRPSDLIMMSINPGTADETAMGVVASNIHSFNSFTTNGQLMNGFIFMGDSLTEDESLPAGPKNAWSQQLLKTSNYVFHLPSYNVAKGGTTIADWTNTYYTTYVTPLLSTIPTNFYYIFIMLGNNSMNQTESVITNQLANLWSRSRTNGLKVIAQTLTTNTSWNLTQMTLWTNVNNDIRAMSNLYDVLIDAALVITNATTQLNVDGVHWLAVTCTNYAQYVSQHFNPPLSSTWNRAYPPSDFPGTTRFGGMSEFDSGLIVQGAVGAAGTPKTGNGKLIWMYHFDGASESLGGYIQAIDTSAGNVDSPLTIRADPLTLYGTDILITGLSQSRGTVFQNASALPASTTERVYINGNATVATNLTVSGAAGIGGAASANYKLQVSGNISMATANQILDLRDSGNEYFRIARSSVDQTASLQNLFGGSPYHLNLQPSGGNVGINNTAPTSTLSVGTNMHIMTSITTPTVTGTNNGIFFASNNTVYWRWTAGGTTTNTTKIAGP